VFSSASSYSCNTSGVGPELQNHINFDRVLPELMLWPADRL